jgi:hypothetical protein
MGSRIAVSVISVALYVILVDIGVRRLWAPEDAVQQAGRHGIAVDVGWWTPFPLGLAYGLKGTRPTPAGGLYSVLVSLSALAGFWLLYERMSTRMGTTARKLLAAALLLGIPMSNAVYGITMWPCAFQVKARDYGGVRSATANVFHEVSLGNIFTWNPGPVQQYELRIAADDPSTVLVTSPKVRGATEGQEVVSYSFSTRQLRRNVAAATWQAGRCVVFGPELNESILDSLDQPADDADLVLNGKRFRKSSDIWKGFLFTANGSYLALFSARGARRPAPTPGSGWRRGQAVSPKGCDPLRSTACFVWTGRRLPGFPHDELRLDEPKRPITVDLYRVRDAVRMGSTTFVTSWPDYLFQQPFFWVDNRIFFGLIAIDEVVGRRNGVMMAALPPEPPQQIPLKSDWSNRSDKPLEEFIENSCHEDPGVELVSMRSVPQWTAKEYFRGVTIEVRIRLQRRLPFPYKLIARGWNKCQTASDAANLDAGEHVLTLSIAADDWNKGCGEVKSLRLIAQDPSGEVPTPLRPPVGTWDQYTPEMFPEENRPEDPAASKRIEQIPADALGQAVMTVVEASRQNFAQLRGERLSQTDAVEPETTFWRARISIPEADACVIRCGKDYCGYHCADVLPGIEPAGNAALRAYGEKLRRATGLKDRSLSDQSIVFEHESGAGIELFVWPWYPYKRLELRVWPPPNAEKP